MPAAVVAASFACALLFPHADAQLAAEDLADRRGYYDIALSRMGLHYVADLAIGSPPVLVRDVVVDTGSSDLVVLEGANDGYYAQDSSTAFDPAGPNGNSSITHQLFVDARRLSFEGGRIVVDNIGASPAGTDASPTAEPDWDVRPLGRPISRSSMLLAQSLRMMDDTGFLHHIENASGLMGLSYGYSTATHLNATWQGLLQAASSLSHLRIYGPGGILEEAMNQGEGEGNATAGSDESGFGAIVNDDGGMTVDFATYQRLVHAVARSTRLAFGLDLNEAGNSSMQLGGFAARYVDSLVWSERAVYDFPRSYLFPMYQLRMCGVNVFSSTTAHWPVLIDTGAVCLTLPAEFYDSVMSWTPARCVDAESQGGLSTESRCYVPADVAARGLPVLSFSLQQDLDLNDDAQPTQLFLPLEELLLPPEPSDEEANAGDLYYCIMKGPSASEVMTQYLSPERSHIAFGTQVLHALYAAFDVEEQRVGLANKASVLDARSLSRANEQCADVAQCVGGQVYYADANACVSPDCEVYALQMLDVETQTCIVAPSWGVFGVVTMAVFAATSFWMHMRTAKLTRDAVADRTRRRRAPPRLQGGFSAWLASLRQTWMTTRAEMQRW